MTHQYRVQDGPFDVRDYPTQPRRHPLAPSQGHVPPPRHHVPEPPREQPPVRPSNPDPSKGRYPDPPQSSPHVHHPEWNVYDGSVYGDDEHEDDDDEQANWPLPIRPSAPQVHNYSPSSSPQPSRLPQRPDYRESDSDPYWPAARGSPSTEQFHPSFQVSHHGSGQWTGDRYSSPASAHPPSRIPRLVAAYPQSGPYDPQQPHPQGPLAVLTPQQALFELANKRPPLGPPPSARRGPAFYYPQEAPVHPIVEEAESMRGSFQRTSVNTGGRDSTASYNSSYAIPVGHPETYVDYSSSTASVSEYERAIEDEQREWRPVGPAADGMREWAEDGEDDAGRDEDAQPRHVGPVRQASLGKKSKPILRNIKGSEHSRKASRDGLVDPSSQHQVAADVSESGPTGAEIPDPIPQTFLKDASETESFASGPERRFGNGDPTWAVGGAAALAAVAVSAPIYEFTNPSTDALTTRTNSSEILASGTGLLDPSSSESESDFPRTRSRDLAAAGMSKAVPPRSHPRSPLAPSADPPMENIDGMREPDVPSIARNVEKTETVTADTSEQASKPRPPRLDIDAATRSNDTRASISTLPELIRRATKLASNLDRGRTASRLGLNWLDGAENDEKKEGKTRRSGDISDMLASFPPPGLSTPPASRDRDQTRRSWRSWSSNNLRHSALHSESDTEEVRERKRRCCGMPLWGFLLLMVLLVLLIAAAIIVPVVLIVVPRQAHANDNNAVASSAAVNSCQRELTCENGGANVITDDGTCRCLCANGFTGTQCTTNAQVGCTTLAVGSMPNATVGNAIPRLIAGAQSNFSVPLDAQTLLALFSSADLGCSVENALVTFDNTAEKRSVVSPVGAGAPTPTINNRGTGTTSNGDAATSDGLVSQSGSPSANPLPAAPVSAYAGSSPSNLTSSPTALDFARVAVLYLFQASGQLAPAVAAQQTLQTYFQSGRTPLGQPVDPANVTLGVGYTCDLITHTIRLGNGTTVGGGDGDDDAAS